MELIETVWQLGPGCKPFVCHEVVVLASWRAGSRLESSVVCTWASDLEGTGLEADITEPASRPPIEFETIKKTTQRVGRHMLNCFLIVVNNANLPSDCRSLPL
jgi:hypothetical protein